MDNKYRFTLAKDERLKKRTYIQELFDSGESFSIYPIKAFYFLRHDTDIDDGIPGWKERIMEPILQFGVGVSKKNFKSAVDRNRIKRLIREAYRLQRHYLSTVIAGKKEWCLKLFVLYTGKELPTYSLIDEKMEQVLNRIEKEIR
jgi:ribonuclease P protein component